MAQDTALAGTSSEAGGIGLRLGGIFKHTDILFAIGIIGILLVLLIPIPTFLLDFLLGISITLSVLILMLVLFISRPLELSSFPTILLIAAILRLALNIASTRLILAHGHEGSNAAGHVIEAFGGFVMVGSAVIGAIVFGILTIINFIVVTKGSGRIAEVAARFSLDAMPGKQMAIDADLSAGLIDEQAAKERRKVLEDENTFFGAMDGASKFVRGDAIAGLLITFINFIGGMIIGIVQRDLSFVQAIDSYTVLTIGDGLVSQIPALVVSVSAGLLVSKAGAEGAADKVIIGQFAKHPDALVFVSVLMGVFAFMPGLPTIPFLIIAGGLGLGAWYAKKTVVEKEMAIEKEKKKAAMTSAGGAASVGPDGKPAEEPISDVLKIDTIRVELGYSLLPLINYEKGTRLPDQVKSLRKQLARDLGFIMPSVRIQDNMQLSNNEYVVRIKDIECARGQVRPDMLLVMDPRGGSIQLAGEDTTEPAFGLPAKWIPETLKEEALFKNLTVVDPPTVITTHLTEVIKDNVTDILSFAETKKLLDSLPEEHDKLKDDVIPDKVSISSLQRILQTLLSERVSIRDLPSILEAVVEASGYTQNIMHITEHVRSRLARQISTDNLNPAGIVEILTLSPEWEQVFHENLHGETEKQLSIPHG